MVGDGSSRTHSATLGDAGIARRGEELRQQSARRTAPRPAHVRARPSRSEERSSLRTCPGAVAVWPNTMWPRQVKRQLFLDVALFAPREQDDVIAPDCRAPRCSATKLARPVRAGLAEALWATCAVGSADRLVAALVAVLVVGGAGGSRCRAPRCPTSGTFSSSWSARSPCAAPDAPTTT